MRRSACLAVLASVVAVPHARGAAYTGVVLYRLNTPAGFSAVTPSGYPMAAAGGQTVGYGTTATGNSHALLWARSSTAVDLNPSGFNSSIAYATNAAVIGGGSTEQVGSVTAANGVMHAALWNSSSGAFIDLNPANLPGVTNSELFCVGPYGDTLTAYGSGSAFGKNSLNPNGYNDHALALNYTGRPSLAAVDLNPTNITGFTNSEAIGGQGQYEVGHGYGPGTSGSNHALSWNNTSSSTIDLNPTNLAGVSTSTATYLATATSGLLQDVGYGSGTATAGNNHALLWYNSANTAVDLNPLGFASSLANRTDGVEQLGVGYKAGDVADAHALLWYGSASSAVQLEGLLPATGAWTNSIANTFDAAGNAYGTATGTYNGVSGTYAVKWIPTSTVSAVNVSGGQVYYFSANAGTGILVRTVPGLTISTGGTAVADPAANHANRQLLVITDAGFTLAGSAGNWTGLLNLNNNDLDLTTASLATVTDQVRQGYAGGTWAGTGGIASGSAAADPKRLTALGVVQNNQGGSPLYSATNLFDGTAPGAADVLVKYTYYGDANLDGVVDGRDYALIDAGYLSDGALTGWYYGDFNYDGKVDASDYTLIDNAFNNQGVSLSTSALTATDTAEVSPPGDTTVPEPATASALTIGGVVLIRRRRRFHPLACGL